MGIFDGPDISKLAKDLHFIESKNDVDQELGHLSSQISNSEFPWEWKKQTTAEPVDELIQNYKEPGANMSIKIHFLHNHSNNFPENCKGISDKQVERFHQDIKLMKERYQGRWDKRVMADYCRGLKRDKSYRHHSRRSKKKIFWNNLHVLY